MTLIMTQESYKIGAYLAFPIIQILRKILQDGAKSYKIPTRSCKIAVGNRLGYFISIAS